MQSSSRFRLPFARWRRAGLYLSGLLIVTVIAVLAIWWLNIGIDFAGGSLWTLQVPVSVTEQQLMEVFSQQDLDNPVVQNISDSGTRGEYSEFIVRTPPVGEEKRQAVLESLQQQFGHAVLLGFDDVSPAIGTEIQSNALKALAAAIIGMIVYISFRFEYRFAITAVIGLLHDIIIMIGVFAIFRFEINAAFVAAVLTIFGYSVNDTVVIFDRIRENRRQYRRDQVVELVEDSVNQTLSRTINTSLTALLAVAAVALLGGNTIRPFAIAIMVGIIAGTYSSIFVSAALWLEWALKGARRRQATSTS